MRPRKLAQALATGLTKMAASTGPAGYSDSPTGPAGYSDSPGASQARRSTGISYRSPWTDQMTDWQPGDYSHQSTAGSILDRQVPTGATGNASGIRGVFQGPDGQQRYAVGLGRPAMNVGPQTRAQDLALHEARSIVADNARRRARLARRAQPVAERRVARTGGEDQQAPQPPQPPQASRPSWSSRMFSWLNPWNWGKTAQYIKLSAESLPARTTAGLVRNVGTNAPGQGMSVTTEAPTASTRAIGRGLMSSSGKTAEVSGAKLLTRRRSTAPQILRHALNGIRQKQQNALEGRGAPAR